MTVWLVIRDDGNSQIAEEIVESVWLTRSAALNRCHRVTTRRGRVEGYKLRLFGSTR